jgi:quercetin dioxygenase-like cupin family protein
MEERSSRFMLSADVDCEEIAPGVCRKIMGWTPSLMVIRVEFGEGTSFPPHNHPHDQITFVMKGEFEIEIEGEKKVLKEGDAYVVPSAALHAVRCLHAGVLMDTFSPAREDFLEG